MLREWAEFLEDEAAGRANILRTAGFQVHRNEFGGHDVWRRCGWRQCGCGNAEWNLVFRNVGVREGEVVEVGETTVVKEKGEGGGGRDWFRITLEELTGPRGDPLPRRLQLRRPSAGGGNGVAAGGGEEAAAGARPPLSRLIDDEEESDDEGGGGGKMKATTRKRGGQGGGSKRCGRGGGKKRGGRGRGK